MSNAVSERFRRYMMVSQFIKEHPDYYDEYELQAIRGYVQRDDLRTIAKTDLVREIYDELGLLPEDANLYSAFVKLIDDQFGLEGKRICEVGGGILPRLGERIHLKQKKGSIVVYDPRLAKDVKGSSRFILRRRMFKETTPTKNVDLLVGLMPCKGAEPLLENALNNNKDFMLWLCEGGPHGDYFDFFESDEEWIDSTIHHARRGVEEKNMGKLIVKKIPDLSEYPIIYNQR